MTMPLCTTVYSSSPCCPSWLPCCCPSHSMPPGLAPSHCRWPSATLPMGLALLASARLGEAAVLGEVGDPCSREVAGQAGQVDGRRARAHTPLSGATGRAAGSLAACCHKQPPAHLAHAAGLLHCAVVDGQGGLGGQEGAGKHIGASARAAQRGGGGRRVVWLALAAMLPKQCKRQRAAPLVAKARRRPRRCRIAAGGAVLRQQPARLRQAAAQALVLSTQRRCIPAQQPLYLHQLAARRLEQLRGRGQRNLNQQAARHRQQQASLDTRQ